jgi:hypothetical protein
LQILSNKGLVYDEVVSWKFWPTPDGFLANMQFKGDLAFETYYKLERDGKTFKDSMSAKATKMFEQAIGSASNFDELGLTSKQVWSGIPDTSLYGASYVGLVGAVPLPSATGDGEWEWAVDNTNSTANWTMQPADRKCVRQYLGSWFLIFASDVTASMLNLYTYDIMWISAGSWQVFAWFFGFFEGFIYLVMLMAAGDMMIAAKIFRYARNAMSVGGLLFASFAPRKDEYTGQSYERNLYWSVLSTFLGFWLYRTLPDTCALPLEEEAEVDQVAEAIEAASEIDESVEEL